MDRPLTVQQRINGFVIEPRTLLQLHKAFDLEVDRIKVQALSLEPVYDDVL
jgi:hypothetical protein